MLRANKKGHVESCVINPKCCKLGELYGESDPNTFEWSDGLIASTVRRFAKELSNDAKSDNKTGQSTTRGGATADSSRNLSEVNIFFPLYFYLFFSILLLHFFGTIWKTSCYCYEIDCQQKC